MAMGRTQILAAVMALLVNAGCKGQNEGPPAIEVDRSRCAHCGMLVSEPAYAAAYQVPGAEGRIFDDIRCLLDAVKREQDPGIRFWFHDAASAVWIDGDDAVFVTSSALRTPMGGGLIAFREAAAAQSYAQRHNGQVMGSLATVLNQGDGNHAAQ
jgi:copper chaperone NosL